MEVDVKFARDIIKLGGKTLRLCMQCANCSVVCPLSPDENPFPRKEMIWAQWGLKERLIRDPDIFLCYNCADCSKYCPRDARPGEVLNAIRARVIAEFAWPKFIGRILNRLWSLPIFLVIPAIIIGALIYGLKLTIPASGEIVYSKFIPIEYVEIPAFILGGWALFIGLIGMWRYWNALTYGGGKQIVIIPKEGAEFEVKGGISFWDSFFYALRDILFHNWFKICEANLPRFPAHFLIFYGFLGLGLVAGIDVVGIYVFGLEHLPWPWEAQGGIMGMFGLAKALGILSGIALVAGTVIAILNRIFNRTARSTGSYHDWFFLVVLLLVGVTGFIATTLRLYGSISAYYAYIVHLYFVFMLLVYAPYSKFAHLLYRTVAMTYARAIGRMPKEVPWGFWERL